MAEGRARSIHLDAEGPRAGFHAFTALLRQVTPEVTAIVLPLLGITVYNSFLVHVLVPLVGYEARRLPGPRERAG